jgi:hypothetical protein
MEKDLNYYFKNLPECLRKEIFSNIIPESRNINFDKYYPNAYETNYNYAKYEVARNNENTIIKNANNLMLSRIPKKNGKHRYYITTVSHTSECSDCGPKCFSWEYCRGSVIHIEYYSSIYVGKNLDEALFRLYIEVENLSGFAHHTTIPSF